MRFYLGNDVWVDVLGDGSVEFQVQEDGYDEVPALYLDRHMVADLISKLKDRK